MPTALVVRDPHAAAALADGRGLAYLAQYFAQPRSIKEAADRLGEPLAKVHYWTHRWRDLGLIEVAETVARKGRPIRRYRAVAQVFEVPSDALPLAKFEARMRRSSRRREAGLAQAVPELRTESTIRVYANERDGDVSMDRTMARKVKRRDAFSSEFELQLTPHEAEELRNDLEDLRDTWLARSRGNNSSHLVVVSLTPAPRPS